MGIYHTTGLEVKSQEETVKSDTELDKFRGLNQDVLMA
jgi:hypothetical protein